MRCVVRPRWTNLVPQAFGDMQREMGELFEQFFANGANGTDSLSAPLSLWEDEGHFHVEVDLPGVNQDAIEVTLEKNTLRIAAVRQAPEGERKYWRQERGFGRVERLINLPETVDADSIEAQLVQGVLTVSLAKRAELKPRRVEVKAN